MFESAGEQFGGGMSEDLEPVDFSRPSEEATGQRPGRRTHSREESDRRVSFTACLLSQLLPTAEIKAQLQRLRTKPKSVGQHAVNQCTTIPSQ